ncbi:MAG: ribonuclease E/G, partial [Bartonella sp.]|nr:ribonuclease E/G [Bartonella sp.]
DSIGTQHFSISKSSIAKEAPLSSTVIEDNDTKETENSILIKSKTVDNNKRRQHKNQQMESNNGSIFPTAHKNDTPNDEDTRRRGRRRGRRGGGRSNQSN